jgi:hypothetical protein
MPKNNSSINNSLFDLLKGKGYSPTMLSTAGKEIPTPDEAEVFQFNFVKDGEDYGKVTLTIDDSSNLIVYYSDDVADSEKETSSESGDLPWYGLLNQLKRFAQRYQLSFELRNTDNLKSDMAKRDYMKKQDQISESRNQRMAEGQTGVSVKKWAAQVRQEHGADTKFSNDKVHDRVIARKDKEIVGSYDRKANNGTVFSPKQDMAEGSYKTYQPKHVAWVVRHGDGHVSEFKPHEDDAAKAQFEKVKGNRGASIYAIDQHSQSIPMGSLRAMRKKQDMAEGYSLKKTNVEKTFHLGDPDEYTQDVNTTDTDYEIINNKTGQVVGTASWTTNDFMGPGALKITMKNGATRWLDIWDSEKGNPQTAFNRFVKDPKTAKKYKEQDNKGVKEMDKSQTPSGRDGRVSHRTYGSRDTSGDTGAERTAKPITAKQATTDAMGILNKQLKKKDVKEMDNRTPSGDRREQRANSPEAIAQREKEQQKRLKQVSPEMRKKLRLPDPDKEDMAEGTESVLTRGTEVTVPHRGKMVPGKILRYVAGKGGYSDAYVVDIGEYESLTVPTFNVKTQGMSEGIWDNIKGAAKEFTRDSTQKMVKQAWENTFWPKYVEPAMKRISIDGRPFHDMVLGEPRIVENDRSKRTLFSQYTIDLVFPIDATDWKSDQIYELNGQLKELESESWNPNTKADGKGFKLINFMMPYLSYEYSGKKQDLVIPVSISSVTINPNLKREQDMAEASGDQVKKVFKKNGKPVGEVGIDPEASSGVGQWYMKCYQYDIDNSGYDSYEEAVGELKYCLKQGVAEGTEDSTQVLSNIVANGDFDALYDLMSANTEAGKIVQRMYNDVSGEEGLHPDDDFEQILNRVFDHLSQDYGQQDMAEGLEDSNIQDAIIDTVERLFYKNDIQDYGSLEAIRQGVKHHFSKSGATAESAIEGILNILNKRMRKSGNYVDLGRFKEALRQGVAHQVKKQGMAEGKGDEYYDLTAEHVPAKAIPLIKKELAQAGITLKFVKKRDSFSDETVFEIVANAKGLKAAKNIIHKYNNGLHVGIMNEQGGAESNQQVNEGYYPMGKQGSYSDAVPTTKIIIQHSRRIEEGEQRYRNIAKIFVENSEGERFAVPTTKPGLARVYARHIAEGGTPYDERGRHITSLVEEYSKMSGFMRATRGKQFNESAQQLVTEAVNYYQSLRESLSKMTGHRGYSAYFESWTPSLMEDGEEQETNLNELFVQETLDPRIESVMPILGKLQRKLGTIKEVDALAEWADNIIEGDGGQEALNPQGIPEATDVTDDNPKSQGGTRAELLRKYANTKKPKDAEAARRAGASQSELKAAADSTEEIHEGASSHDLQNAILYRVEMRYPELFSKYGHEYVADKALDVASFYAGAEEIGSSDMSAMVNHLVKTLEHEGEHGLDENLDANQKRAGQLGPTEKVGPKGAVGKLVGNESIAEGEGNLVMAIQNLNGWHQTDSSNPDIEEYYFDDNEDGYDADGYVQHNLKTGEIVIDFEDKSGDYGGSVNEKLNSIGDAMNILRKITTQKRYNSGKKPNFDTLGGRTIAGPDDLYKTDRAGKVGTLTKGRMDTMKMSSPHRMNAEPKGVLPEGQEDLEAILRIIRK